MTRFGERIKASRERKKRFEPKWTQEYVATKVGVARTTYTAYENGTKEPTIETINKLADLLEVTTDYLMGRSDTPRPVSDGAKLLLDLIELSDDEAIAKIQENFVWRGEPVSEEKVKEILHFARFRMQQDS